MADMETFDDDLMIINLYYKVSYFLTLFAYLYEAAKNPKTFKAS